MTILPLNAASRLIKELLDLIPRRELLLHLGLVYNLHTLISQLLVLVELLALLISGELPVHLVVLQAFLMLIFHLFYLLKLLSSLQSLVDLFKCAVLLLLQLLDPILH